ncbi:MAG: hypothetical protein ACOZBW_02965 [Thermodesulfobacteriota bacterium]
MHALLVGSNASSFALLAAQLEAAHFQTVHVETVEKALAAADDWKFDLVVVDEKVGDRNGLDCIRTMVMRHPLLNCAAVSALPANDFHEASEGLGVLMQLPPEPGRADARKLIDHLDAIVNLGKSAARKGEAR